MVDLLKFTLDKAKPALTFEMNVWFLFEIVVITIILLWISKKDLLYFAESVEMEVGSKGFSVKAKVDRTQQNIFIAHRILIELETRKAAIEIDPDHDVIYEVYTSWYKLFGIIRDEIKDVPAKSLYKSSTTHELLRLTRAILNDGLRPHLTKYQAAYLKWYEAQKASTGNEERTPQQIQRDYHQYDEIIQDMKNVNKMLIDYADQLRKLIGLEVK